MTPSVFLGSIGTLLGAIVFCSPPAGGATETSGLPARPSLAGMVQAEEGGPLAQASVFIYTAAPRVGRGVLCPSCYADCRKSARSDAQGAFRIEDLDPSLIFRVLVVAPGRKAQFLEKVDPVQGRVGATLAKLDLQKLGPKNQLLGSVCDQDGQPIFGAAVSFDMFYGDEANCGGLCDGVDPIAVTNEAGEFVLTTEKGFEWMTVEVQGRGLAKRKFFKLASGKHHQLKLGEGATVTGRVLKGSDDGKPIEIGLVSVDRSENFTGEFVTRTQGDGRFSLPNIPPYQAYYLYGRMDSLQGIGTVPARKVRVGADGTVKDVGDIKIQPGHRLTGRVVLSDGSPIPPNTRLLLGRDDAWDSSVFELPGHGNFEFKDVPAGVLNLSLSLPGYRLSDRNRSLDRLNGSSLIGLVDQDLVGLIILLEPGQFQPPDPNVALPPGADPQPRNQTLAGAELANL